MSRKKSLHTFIDEMTYYSRHKDHKTGDTVVYKRLSDDVISMGEIKWFDCSKKKDSTVYVTIVDHILGSFQTCAYQDIDSTPAAAKLKKLRDKIAKCRRK